MEGVFKFVMKITIAAILLSMMLLGCATTTPNAKRAEVNAQKIELVSKVAYQTDRALIKTNVPLAKSYNDRVLSVVGMPELKDMNTTNFDGQIISIQSKEDKIDKAIEANSARAEKLDAELSSYHSWFGLGAIWLGVKQLVTTSIWLLLGLGIIFIVLRVLSASNPIAGALFGIFNSIGASLIHGIGLLVPKAVEEVKSISQSTLTKVVDTIQDLQNKNVHNLETVKTELSNKLSDKEKAVISTIKKDLFY